MLVMVGKLQQEKRTNCVLNAVCGSGTMVGLLHIYSYNKSYVNFQFSSVAQLCLTLRPHGLQHGEAPNIFPTPSHVFTL